MNADSWERCLMHGGKSNAAGGAVRTVCLLRLSALGDVSPVLPIVHTLRQQAPQTRISWILGRVVARQLGRASCRERVFLYVEIPVVGGSLKTKQPNTLAV